MPRTIVYPSGPEPGVGRGAARSTVPDDYTDKLLKYVPAEVIAFFVPVYAVASGGSALSQWFVLAIAVIGNAAYLRIRAPESEPPHWYFYVLSIAAFFAWAIGTTPVGTELLHLRGEAAGLAMPIGLFVIPLVDEAVSRRPHDRRLGNQPRR